MNTRAIRALRRKMDRDDPVLGLWITLECASITEMAVALGLDWVVIDAEHGHLDWSAIASHVRATVRSKTTVLVRIAERSTTLTKRALDIGADGIVIPWVEDASELEDAVRDCRYPPEGRRGIGGERATVWSQCLREHTSEANENVLVVPMIESVTGAKRITELCKVDGVELFFFGPADHSSSAGFRGQWEGPGVADQIQCATNAIRKAGKHCGVMATSDDLRCRIEQGFLMIGVASDMGLMFRSLRQSLRTIGRDVMPATSLDADDATPVAESDDEGTIQ